MAKQADPGIEHGTSARCRFAALQAPHSVTDHDRIGFKIPNMMILGKHPSDNSSAEVHHHPHSYPVSEDRRNVRQDTSQTILSHADAETHQLKRVISGTPLILGMVAKSGDMAAPCPNKYHSNERSDSSRSLSARRDEVTPYELIPSTRSQGQYPGDNAADVDMRNENQNDLNSDSIDHYEGKFE